MPMLLVLEWFPLHSPYQADVDRLLHCAAPELVGPQRFRLTNIGVTRVSDVYAFGVRTWEVGR